MSVVERMRVREIENKREKDWENLCVYRDENPSEVPSIAYLFK